MMPGKITRPYQPWILIERSHPMRNTLKNLVRVLSRPFEDDRQHHVHPYRGYGSREEIDFVGRVFRQTPTGEEDETAGNLLLYILRRLFRRGVANAVLEARFAGSKARVKTDRFGYFHVEMRLNEPPRSDRLWHEVELEMLEPRRMKVPADVFIPPESARYVVISDIDDTVIETGVTSKIKMLWRMMTASTGSRVAFPGIAAFYRALHRGRSGAELNPILYVSRGPWGIYELLDAFFDRHGIPIGPILFLREWGVSIRRPFPVHARDHKIQLVRDMLSLYEHPFILIGDSGERDPEIYAQVVREYPGRVLGIYIRNVSRHPKRQEEIDKLAKELVAEGSSLVLVSDTFAMARHAVEEGLISPDALGQVLGERIEQEGEPDVHPVEHVGGPTRHDTQEAVDEGEIDKALEEETGERTAPNVVIEPRSNRYKTQSKI